MGKEGVGTVINGIKYVYNSFNDWVKQFPWLSVWQFRKAMNRLRELGIVQVIRYKSRQWNQTNYYSLDSDRLLNFLKGKSAESIGKSDLCVDADREENIQQIEVRDSKLSYIDTKNTIQKETAKTSDPASFQDARERASSSIQAQKISHKKFAADSFFEDKKEEEPHQTELNGFAGSNKPELEANQQVVEEEKNLRLCNTNVTKKINSEWKVLVEELDGIGVRVNKTVINLVKIYSEEEVRNAISLIKIRKREKFIPNLAGYFTAALKENWTGSSLGSEEDSGSDAIDKGSVFRLWYDLAKELGYCTSQEMRDEEQLVLISGTWEKWEDAVNRGYSLDYFKGVMKRSKQK